MKIAIELIDDAAEHWSPGEAQCQLWAEMALSVMDHSDQEQPCEISLRLVDEPEMTRLNGDYRGKNSPTNVLSFPSHIPANMLAALEYRHLGDIAICPAVLEKEAAEQTKTLEAHWAHLLVHGLLHLLGHDHDSDEQAEVMENLEIQALKKLGFPNPYLVG